MLHIYGSFIFICFIFLEDVSRMVVGNVAASGPVSRRQPLNRGSSRLTLPSLAKLNFDEGADSDEEHNTKQVVVISGFGCAQVNKKRAAAQMGRGRLSIGAVVQVSAIT